MNRALMAGVLAVAASAPVQAQDSMPMPAGLVEHEVTVGPLALGGTLTMPAAGNDFPAVVLVQGSGAHDRDETIRTNKPFRDLAWGLASRGIAVLRYDKRTMVHPESFLGHPFTADDEVVDDAVAAMGLLRASDRVDSTRVVVLGHSLGGTLAPRIAARAPGTAGIIIMAGATAPLDEMVVRQVHYLTADALQGPDSALATRRVNVLLRLVERIRALTPADSASTTLLLGATPSYWLDLRAYHPADVADSLNLPVLVLHGLRDYQVTTEEESGWHEALGTRRDVTFHEYPGLNHLFLAGSGKPGPAEYGVPGHIPDQVLDDIATWFGALTPRRAPHP